MGWSDRRPGKRVNLVPDRSVTVSCSHPHREQGHSGGDDEHAPDDDSGPSVPPDESHASPAHDTVKPATARAHGGPVQQPFQPRRADGPDRIGRRTRQGLRRPPSRGGRRSRLRTPCSLPSVAPFPLPSPAGSSHPLDACRADSSVSLCSSGSPPPGWLRGGQVPGGGNVTRHQVVPIQPAQLGVTAPVLDLLPGGFLALAGEPPADVRPPEGRLTGCVRMNWKTRLVLQEQ